MRLILACLILWISSTGFAQTYSVDLEYPEISVVLETTTSVEAIQSNLTDSTLNVHMELLDVAAPASWDIFLCSPTFCSAPGEYELDYHLDPWQAAQIKVSFAPGSINGQATATWVVTDIDNPINTDTFSISASSLVGTSELIPEPNITVRHLMVTSNSPKVTGMVLRDMQGKCLLRSNSDRLNIESLPSGIYVVQVFFANSVISRKIYR